ncbi:hypothetical protein DPMN_135003 [Dreissena polymorpha]|uniref:C2H2-type domain-containing protein n=1 Tax=Dreissena polymorpha TaxID=45954 RepID=A0A9D4FWQ2_DREPO|nr:hypothetical protein DPMN_135003 [Dreissena polymorpha]
MSSSQGVLKENLMGRDESEVDDSEGWSETDASCSESDLEGYEEIDIDLEDELLKAGVVSNSASVSEAIVVGIENGVSVSEAIVVGIENGVSVSQAGVVAYETTSIASKASVVGNENHASFYKVEAASESAVFYDATKASYNAKLEDKTITDRISSQTIETFSQVNDAQHVKSVTEYLKKIEESVCENHNFKKTLPPPQPKGVITSGELKSLTKHGASLQTSPQLDTEKSVYNSSPKNVHKDTPKDYLQEILQRNKEATQRKLQSLQRSNVAFKWKRRKTVESGSFLSNLVPPSKCNLSSQPVAEECLINSSRNKPKNLCMQTLSEKQHLKGGKNKLRKNLSSKVQAVKTKGKKRKLCHLSDTSIDIKTDSESSDENSAIETNKVFNKCNAINTGKSKTMVAKTEGSLETKNKRRKVIETVTLPPELVISEQKYDPGQIECQKTLSKTQQSCQIELGEKAEEFQISDNDSSSNGDISSDTGSEYEFVGGQLKPVYSAFNGSASSGSKRPVRKAKIEALARSAMTCVAEMSELDDESESEQRVDEDKLRSKKALDSEMSSRKKSTKTNLADEQKVHKNKMRSKKALDSEVLSGGKSAKTKSTDERTALGMKNLTTARKHTAGISRFASENKSEKADQTGDEECSQDEVINDVHFKVGNSKKGMYTCKKCLKGFSNLYSLAKHMNSHASAGSSTSVIQSLSDLDHKGKQCQNSKNKDVEIVNIETKNANIEFETKDEDSTKKIYDSAIEIVSDDKEEFHCNVCSIKFESAVLLNIHGRIHKNSVTEVKVTDDASFICGLCSRSFKNAEDLSEHIMSHQKGDKRSAPVPKGSVSATKITKLQAFVCLQCSCVFDTRSLLDGHDCKEESINTCRISGQGFDALPKLESHVSSQSNISPSKLASFKEPQLHIGKQYAEPEILKIENEDSSDVTKTQNPHNVNSFVNQKAAIKTFSGKSKRAASEKGRLDSNTGSKTERLVEKAPADSCNLQSLDEKCHMSAGKVLPRNNTDVPSNTKDIHGNHDSTGLKVGAHLSLDNETKQKTDGKKEALSKLLKYKPKFF